MYKNSSQELQDGGYKITMQASSYSVNFILWKLWLKTNSGPRGWSKDQHRNIQGKCIFKKIQDFNFLD